MKPTRGKKLWIISALGLLCLAAVAYLLSFDRSLRASLTLAGPPPEVPGRTVLHSLFLVTAGYGAALAAVLLMMTVVGTRFGRRRRTARTIHELRERLRFFSEGLRDCSLFLLGPDGRIARWSPSAERLQGFRPRDVEGKPFSALFTKEDARLGRPDNCLRQAEADGRSELVCSHARRDGSLFPARSVVAPIRDPYGALRAFTVVTHDITELKRNEDLLKKFSLSVEQSADLVVITDRNGRVEFVNRAAEVVTGYSRDELSAGGLDLLRLREQDPDGYRVLWDTVLSGGTFQAEVMAIRKSGEPIYLDQCVTPIRDQAGMVTHAVFTGSDLTPLRHLHDKLDFLASYDTLTGLPNRDLFTNRLVRVVSGEALSGSIAVLAIDIDRFKYINEIYGLETGNKVLKQVAESLSVSVNKGDTVGRLGSDEFGIVLHDIKRPADVVLFVKMIMKNVPQIIMSGGEEIPVTLALGIALSPADGTDARALMKKADTALSKAKAQGRNNFQFYTVDMNVGISELMFMERRLSEALQNREYILTFQPYCHLSTRTVAGAEALLKWNNEEFGQVSPAKFIPMLEETGMIIDVGRWVLATACSQLRDWSNGMSTFPVAVNLSPSQFRHEYLVETVEDFITQYGIDPRRLTLEVTESTFMKDQDFAVSVLRRLKALGVAISIDDFGTGYSSLSYLKKFPVDYVKIDQSFVRDVSSDPDATSLVSSIIAMAHGLGLRTIAEGVETEQQWNILRLLKCDMGQGFYFSPALSPREIEELVLPD